MVQHTIGCHIKIDSGRLDFAVDYRFTGEDIHTIEEFSNSLIRKNYPIELRSRTEAKEARYWESNGYLIPCGGTHVKRTGEVGEISIKRKNLGKGKERIMFTYKNS